MIPKGERMRRIEQAMTSCPAARSSNAFWTAGALSVTLAVSAGGARPAVAAGDDPAVAGHALVATHCSGCHAIEKTGESPLAAAPRFRDLHLRYKVEQLDEALVEGIATAHPEMPQFEFDPVQAQAIIAYLKSLER